MYAEKSMGFESLAPLIGHTPLLKIRYRFGGRDRVLFAKAEHYNLTGSIKDRVALHILRKAYAEGTIRPGVPIAEPPAAIPAFSFPAVGAALGASGGHLHARLDERGTHPPVKALAPKFGWYPVRKAAFSAPSP